MQSTLYSNFLLCRQRCVITRIGVSANYTTRRSFSIDSGAGIGLHNVHDRVMGSVRGGKTLFQYTAEPKTCSIIGAPMTYGQPYVGTDTSPSLLRKNGLLKHLSALDWRVEDIPDLDLSASDVQKKATTTSNTFTGNARNHIQVGMGTKLIAEIVYDKLQKGRFPLILGGDHSIGIGSLSGILEAYPDIGVLWIDAHADLNTPWISESGNMHGMPIGICMLEHEQTIPGFEWLINYPKLQSNQIVYIGLRDVDPEERKIIQQLHITAYTMHDIDHYGIGTVMDMALHHLSGRPLHLSYDIDAVDPVLAPATGTAVRGGLTFREAHYVAEAAAQSGRLISGEIVELNPTLADIEGADDTVELGLQIITSLMGKSII